MNRDMLLWVLVAALAIAGITTGVIVGTRGIRNNNPGNIRHGSSQWQGMSLQQTDDEYVQFDDPVYGIRAMAKLLKNYQARYGLDTVAEIIGRYAPPSENITGAYVDHVAKLLGVSPNHEIDVAAALPELVPAIILHENGSQPYSRRQINQGIALS
jgi:hypothetical protein